MEIHFSLVIHPLLGSYPFDRPGSNELLGIFTFDLKYQCMHNNGQACNRNDTIEIIYYTVRPPIHVAFLEYRSALKY